MDKSLISVGLLTYNHEKYISDCLKGILSQTYQKMELIVLDDASSDNTVKIIESYMPQLEEKFERVKFIKNKQNCGNVPHNCNIIENEVKGEFYFSVSGDDIILPHCISTLYENLILHPDCSVIYANGIYTDDDFHFGDKPDMLNLVCRAKKSGIEPNNFSKQLLNCNLILSPSVMIYSKILEIYGNHDESIAFEDYEYWLRISEKEKIFYLNEPIFLYRRAYTSMSNYNLGEQEKKLRIGIEAVYKTKKKYIDRLTKEEANQCWETFYKSTVYQIKKFNCESLFNYLKLLLKNENYDVLSLDSDKYFMNLNNQEKIIEKLYRYKNIISSYLKNSLKKENPSIAIYGFSNSAKILLEILLNSKINVKYIIDKKGCMLNAPLTVYKATDEIPPVDAVIIAPVGIYDEVYPLMKQKNSCVLELSKILENCSLFF